MKKLIFWLSTMLVFIVPAGITGALLAVGASRPTQVQFVNYLDYISDESRARIREEYGYREFSDLPELRSAIENRQIPAGVGSDYYNVQLANAGLIQKLDFNAIYDGITVNGLTFSTTAPLQKTDVATALEALYTPETWNLLNEFDGQLTGPARGSALWEYMAPYFIQQKVIVINPYKVTAQPGQEAALATLKTYDQAAISAVFNNDKSYQNILQRLSAIGFRAFAVNNYMRDNLAIGSEAAFGVDKFTMDVTSTNYGQLVDGFGTVINSFTGTKRIIDSGFETLSAVHPAGNAEGFQADVGLLYNGDALDAFLGYDQIDGETHDEYSAAVRIIVPTNSTFLLDGVVVPSYVTGEALTTANRILRHALFENATYIPEAEAPAEGEAAPSETATATEEAAPAAEAEPIDINMPYVNFDAVNYTTPFRAVFQYVLNNYFEELTTTPENPNQTMAGTDTYASEIFTISGQIDPNHLTTVITPNLETVVQSAYLAKIRTIF